MASVRADGRDAPRGPVLRRIAARPRTLVDLEHEPPFAQRGLPAHVVRAPRVLSKESWVKISQVRTLSTERLSARAARLDESDVGEVIDRLLELIG